MKKSGSEFSSGLYLRPMVGVVSEDKLEHDGIEPTSHVAHDHDPPPYEYSPLPTATSIRLLKLLPSPADQIRCELNTVDLEDDVKFDALSYTWGNPITLYERPDEELQACNPGDSEEVIRGSGAAEFVDEGKKLVIVDIDAFNYRMNYPFIPYEEVKNDTEKTHPILCNGGTISVTENLFEALYMFRRYAMREIAIPGDDLQATFRMPLSIYIWIDAICIDQENIPERNSQIMVMGRIYSTAQNVFGWIGKTDAFSRLGLVTLTDLFKGLLEDPSIQNRWYGSLYDVEGVNERDWLALFAVLQRLWFRRAWIVQEAVFASRLTMICGSNVFAWVMIEVVLRFMAKTRLDERVSEMVQNLMRREPLVEELRTLRKAIVSTRDHGATYRPSTSPKYILSVNPKAVYTLAAGVRLVKQRLGIRFDHLYKSSKHADPDISRDSRTSDEGSSRSSKTSGGPIRGADGDLYDANDERGYCLSATEPYPKLMSAHFIQSPKVAILHIDPGPQPPISLLSILSTFRMCGASDPRDKIFAFLGHAAKGRAESTPNHYALKADYGTSVPEVYITTTLSMLKSSEVTVLSHV